MVSIHAPARGATADRLEKLGGRHGFNPRAREGRDSKCARIASRMAGVSIHAPARGATSAFDALEDTTNAVSIHAPARGATAKS